MGSKEVCYIGYHGTNQVNAISIKKEGFKPSVKGWLGKGVYFFEEDKDLAYKWCKRKFESQKLQVLRREIKVNADRVFDISNPHSKACKYFFKEKENYIRLLETKGYYITAETVQKAQTPIFERICTIKNYCLVRAYTYTFEDYDKKYHLSSNIPNGVELCIRDLKCIFEGDDKYE